MEIEAKFQIPDEGTFQRLQEADTLAGFTLGAVSITELSDRYLDTRDGAIRAGGYACRLRQTDGITLATAKGLGRASGAIHRREEHEVELPEPQLPQRWPSGTARETILRLCGDKELSVLFEVKQTRHSHPLYDGDRLVAEVSLDRVCLSRGDMASATFLELEAELLADGHEEDLERIGTGLLELWGLIPESRSKYERGLALTEPGMAGSPAVLQGLAESKPRSTHALETSMKDPRSISIGGTSIEAASPAPVELERVASVELPPARDWLPKRPGVGTDDPMSEAGRKILRFHFQRMVYNEPGTRLGEDIEALHDMRVATRRMRAAFRVFGDYYHTKEISPYLKGLKRTGRALGAVRDLDVFQAKVHAYLDSLPESQEGDLDSLLEVLELRRSTARDRMITYLNSEKHRRFVARFDRFVTTPDMGSLPLRLCDDEPRPFRVRHVAPTSIYQRLENVRAYDEWIQIPDPPLSRLHALRIACKRLRYTLEFFREVLGPDTGTVIKEVVVIQDHLGALQDTVVASSILRDHLCQGMRDQEFAPEHLSDHEKASVSPGVTTYLAAQQAEMQHLLETFPAVWQKIIGAQFSQLIARAVMVL